MRTYVCWYRGFDIYKWSTGKYEAYYGVTAVGLSSLMESDVREQIDTFLNHHPERG